MKKRNTEIEGARFFLSATIIQVHHIKAYWWIGQNKAPWLAVNGFLVISAFFAVASLDSSWRQWQTRVIQEVDLPVVSEGDSDLKTPRPVEEQRNFFHRFLCQYTEFVMKRIPPFIWVTWSVIILLKPYDRVPLLKRMFYPPVFPLTSLWALTLQRKTNVPPLYHPDPLFWYMCATTFFFICAPFVYQLLNALKRMTLGTWHKNALYIVMPFVVCAMDIWVVRALTFPDLMTKRRHGSGAHILQHSPFAYVGKFITAMTAASLWNELEIFPLALSLLPVIDLLILTQAILCICLPSHGWIEARWTLLYISVFTPGHCLIIWSLLRGVGCQSPIRRMLGSRYVGRISHGCSLFVFVLHMPIHLGWFGGARWNSTGTVCSTLCAWLISTHSQDAHVWLLSQWSRLTDRVMLKLG